MHSHRTFSAVTTQNEFRISRHGFENSQGSVTFSTSPGLKNFAGAEVRDFVLGIKMIE